jgi:hypothetical protein
VLNQPREKGPGRLIRIDSKLKERGTGLSLTRIRDPLCISPRHIASRWKVKTSTLGQRPGHEVGYVPRPSFVLATPGAYRPSFALKLDLFITPSNLLKIVSEGL